MLEACGAYVHPKGIYVNLDFQELGYSKSWLHLYMFGSSSVVVILRFVLSMTVTDENKTIFVHSTSFYASVSYYTCLQHR